MRRKVSLLSNELENFSCCPFEGCSKGNGAHLGSRAQKTCVHSVFFWPSVPFLPGSAPLLGSHIIDLRLVCAYICTCSEP